MYMPIPNIGDIIKTLQAQNYKINKNMQYKLKILLITTTHKSKIYRKYNTNVTHTHTSYK